MLVLILKLETTVSKMVPTPDILAEEDAQRILYEAKMFIQPYKEYWLERNQDFH